MWKLEAAKEHRLALSQPSCPRSWIARFAFGAVIDDYRQPFVEVLGLPRSGRSGWCVCGMTGKDHLVSDCMLIGVWPARSLAGRTVGKLDRVSFLWAVLL